MEKEFNGFVSENSVIIVAAVVSLLFKEFIINIVKSLVFRMTSGLKEDDVLIFWDGSKSVARIVRIGWMSTTLFLYEVNAQGIVTGGHRITMQNIKLENVKLLKRLSMIDESDLKIFAKDK